MGHADTHTHKLKRKAGWDVGGKPVWKDDVRLVSRDSVGEVTSSLSVAHGWVTQQAAGLRAQAPHVHMVIHLQAHTRRLGWEKFHSDSVFMKRRLSKSLYPGTHHEDRNRRSW